MDDSEASICRTLFIGDNQEADRTCTRRCVITFWFTMVKMAIILIMLTVIQIWLFCNFYISCSKYTQSKEEMKKLPNFVKNTCIISIAFAILSVIFDFIHVYEGFICEIPLHKGTFQGVRACADFTMFGSLLAFYIYLYFRLLKAFEGSTYRLSGTFTVITGIIFVCIIILNIWYIALVATDFNNQFEIENEFYNKMHGIVYGIFTWFYMILFFILVMTFIYKLHKLTIIQYSVSEFSQKAVPCRNNSPPLSPVTPSANNIDNLSPNMSVESLQPEISRAISIGDHPGTHIDDLISVVTKQANLTVIAFIVFILRFGYRFVVGTFFDEEHLSEIIWMVSYSWRDLVLLFNTFVMYLGFGFNKKQYEYCCHCCYRTCRDICVWSMDKKSKALQLEKIAKLQEKREKNTQSPHLNTT